MVGISLVGVAIAFAYNTLFNNVNMRVRVCVCVCVCTEQPR